MSSTTTPNNMPGLPETGSTYPATKSSAITFSNNSPFTSSSSERGGGADSTATATGDSGSRISAIPAHPTNYSTDAEPLNSHHRPSLSLSSDASGRSGQPSGPGSVGSGVGVAAAVEPLAGDTTIRRPSIAQNAPGRLGERGENILGAMGFGGAHVERPREDQGLGEKIAEFLGA